MTKIKHFEILDDRFKRCVQTDEPLEQLWTGGKWTEGPVYSAAHRCLYFSDIPNDRRMRWDELSGVVSDFRSNLGCYTNGATMDRQGRQVTCEQGTRSVVRIEHDGTNTTLASHFNGKRFNSPNDVVVRSDNSIWFTDPAYGIDSPYEGFEAPREVDGEHVYRIDPKDGTIKQVTNDFACPNGLAFSLDEQFLYIVDSCGSKYPSGQRHMRKFTVSDDGMLEGGDVFAECTAGVFDGLRLDNNGRIWTSAQDGVHCYDPDETLIGKIHIPEEVSNLCFGGPKLNKLFITASSSLYCILLPVSGISDFARPVSR